jgi:hypothetical protein
MWLHFGDLRRFPHRVDGKMPSAMATPPGSYSIQATSSVGGATDAQPLTVLLTITE